MKYLVFNPERCFGCHACEIACKQEKNIHSGRLLRIETLGPIKLGGKLQLCFIPRLCLHCTNAPCLDVCPTGALERGFEGIVTMDHERCIECGNCLLACHVPGSICYIQPGGKLMKCDLCIERVSAGVPPSCAMVCPTDAMIYGELDELKSRFADKKLILYGKFILAL